MIRYCSCCGLPETEERRVYLLPAWGYFNICLECKDRENVEWLKSHGLEGLEYSNNPYLCLVPKERK